MNNKTIHKHTEKAKHIMKLMRPSKRRSRRGGDDNENINAPSSQPVLLKIEKRVEEREVDKITEESVIKYLNDILASYLDELSSSPPTTPYDNETFFFEKDGKVNALSQRRHSKVFDVYYSSNSSSSCDRAASKRRNIKKEQQKQTSTDKLCQKTIDRYLSYEESLKKRKNTCKILDSKTSDSSHAQNVILDSPLQMSRKPNGKSSRSKSMYVNKTNANSKTRVTKALSYASPNHDTPLRTQTNTCSLRQKRQTPNKEYTISLYKTTDDVVGQNIELVCTMQAS